jgi:hypothetical protein
MSSHRLARELIDRIRRSIPELRKLPPWQAELMLRDAELFTAERLEAELKEAFDHGWREREWASEDGSVMPRHRAIDASKIAIQDNT